jgi:chromate reductase, NAD(P)H dehydrogenase (quinone)
MIAVISGSNRQASNTRKVAGLVEEILTEAAVDVQLLDLAELPPDLLSPSSYTSPPAGFARFQDAIVTASGVVTVVPEYNGSFPGVLKLFIDVLRFPDSLTDTPVAFVGLSSGRGGGVRAVEQLEMVYHYRRAHLFGRRCFLPEIERALDAEGRLVDPDAESRLRAAVRGFANFVGRLHQRQV